MLQLTLLTNAVMKAACLLLQAKEQGWVPQHVCLYNDSTSEMVGCVPLYLKSHSYGEYVFDHSWASTHMRVGLPYYPKLQSCVPFTPVTGNRLLVKPGPLAAAVTTALAKGLLQVTGKLYYHASFPWDHYELNQISVLCCT